MGFAGGDVNLFRYVHNNPTNATDPSGLQERVYHIGRDILHQKPDGNWVLAVYQGQFGLSPWYVGHDLGDTLPPHLQKEVDKIDGLFRGKGVVPLPEKEGRAAPPERLRDRSKVRVAVLSDYLPEEAKYNWVSQANTKRGVSTAQEVADYLETKNPDGTPKFPDHSIDVLVIAGHGGNPRLEEVYRQLLEEFPLWSLGSGGSKVIEAREKELKEKLWLKAGAGVATSVDVLDETTIKGSVASRIAKKLSPKAEVFLSACHTPAVEKDIRKLSANLGGVRVTAPTTNSYSEGYATLRDGKEPWVSWPPLPGDKK
jgi:hypothetical protein